MELECEARPQQSLREKERRRCEKQDAIRVARVPHGVYRRLRRGIPGHPSPSPRDARRRDASTHATPTGARVSSGPRECTCARGSVHGTAVGRPRAAGSSDPSAGSFWARVHSTHSRSLESGAANGFQTRRRPGDVPSTGRTIPEGTDPCACGNPGRPPRVPRPGGGVQESGECRRSDPETPCQRLYRDARRGTVVSRLGRPCHEPGGRRAFLRQSAGERVRGNAQPDPVKFGR